MTMTTEPTISWSTPSTRSVRDVTVKASSGFDPRYDGSATEKQISFARSLAEQVGVQALLEGELAKSQGPSKARASALIERLLVLKEQKGSTAVVSAPTTGMDLTGLAGGYYAATVDGVTKFFRIDKPAEGRWNGWVFVKIQASDDLHPQGRQAPGKAYQGSSQDYLRQILANEQEAFALYGKQIGRCGICGRTLTDETSRARGIGPVCAEKLGY